MMTKTFDKTPTLGDKLKKTLDELEEARLKTLEEKANADMAKVRKEKAKKERLVSRIQNRIVSAIEAGKVPLVKIEAHDEKEWIRKAEKGQAEYQDLWSQLIRDFGEEKLRLVVSEGHDGMGMKDWLNVSVEPSAHKIVYRNDGTREPTLAEIAMDPRPVVDDRIRGVTRGISAPRDPRDGLDIS
jgi:hypothetical protein